MAKKSIRRATALRTGSRSRWPRLLLVGAALVAAALWYYRAPIAGYAGVSTSYMARVGCACRFVGERTLDDCAKDKLDGMELVSLSADEDERSVTARFALMRPATATYREGYGCVLEDWDG